ncbi:MAG: PEP-CTERM sorting domain-containing protein [Proteobacteria bacterium]|nr:PEP-CTERM sorting domain-containing protein [Pseudomonadota bacterium]
MSCYRVWAVLAVVSAALSSAGNALAGPGVAQVPEPTTLALFAMGAVGTLGVAWVKSRRRK